MHRSFVLHGIFLLVLTGTTVFAAPGFSNLDMVVGTLEEAVAQLLSRMDAPADSVRWDGPVFIESQARHPADWLVGHILTERLLDRGFEVAVDSSAAQLGRVRLSYRLLDLGISGQSGLWGSQVSRQTRATLALRLKAGETLLWQDEERVQKSDRIAKDRLDLQQSTAYDFARIELEERRWGKFVEPVIVSTVLGGLIYIFFSNR